MHNFKQLKIWEMSMRIVEDVYVAVVGFPESEKYGLVNQMKRCSVSIPSNIAEGSGRNSEKDFGGFLYFSLSSAFELETQLILSNRLSLIRESESQPLLKRVSELQKMIYAFINQLVIQ